MPKHNKTKRQRQKGGFFNLDLNTSGLTNWFGNAKRSMSGWIPGMSSNSSSSSTTLYSPLTNTSSTTSSYPPYTSTGGTRKRRRKRRPRKSTYRGGFIF